MNKADLEQRTKRFAVHVTRFINTFRRNRAGEVISHQLMKSGTSIGANYREANRAQSSTDFLHKISIVTKEAAETQYWLELCAEANIGDQKTVKELHIEATELLAIFTRIGKTMKIKIRSKI